jgi:hypothetical protein
MARRRKTATRRRVTKGELLLCAGCGERIHAEYVRDLTKQPWHPVCRRLGAPVNAPPPPRYLGTTKNTCDGCDLPVTEHDDTLTVNAAPWHRECYRRR